ncbi:MAG: hypothetical protein M0018_03640 [Nitrospiraceae bacterium]|nr:hypothetical protein [Nitrospiraceae bacterium]
MKAKTGKFKKLRYALFGAIFFPVIFCGQARAYGFTVYYLYKLANFSGFIPFSFGTQLALDDQTGEVYVINGGVSIFNTHGMQTFRFGESAGLGSIQGLAVDKDGNIMTLSYERDGMRYFIGFCNYRGELERKIGVTGLPPDFSAFKPQSILLKGGRLYLVDKVNMLVAQIDAKGVCLKTWDLFRIMGWDKVKNDDGSLLKPGAISAFGFTIDGEGNMYFTAPTSFRAYKVTPDGKASGFGQGGDGPGKFGVVSGIAVDSKGYIYVSDRLRCVVMIFDKNLDFVKEFGFRSYGPGGLIVPDDMVIGKDGTLYVSQGGDRGVDVFRMDYD